MSGEVSRVIGESLSTLTNADQVASSGGRVQRCRGSTAGGIESIRGGHMSAAGTDAATRPVRAVGLDAR
jgi:hypothetical protein